ncbi:MAG: histone deacetylase [Chloroflexi bacterium]|nr:histone deacetylase [Chloroflexota bacterium]
MKIFYADQYPLTLPEGHIYPAEKYVRLRFELLSQGVIQNGQLFKAHPAEMDQILLAHSKEYYDEICSGRINTRKLRVLGLPWSEALIERAHLSVGGAIAAAREALQSGVAGALSGGTHHAFYDEGRGFCIFNDAAVVILDLLKKQAIRRAAVIDVDTHQGNGTASIFNHNKDVFILDIYGSSNYPVRKVPASLNIPLPTGTQDDEYLDALSRSLPSVFSFNPDIIFYIGGVDPLGSDRFNKLALSMQGLQERDKMVFEECRNHHVPVILTMGGGYSKVDVTVQAHVNTYKMASIVYH